MLPILSAGMAEVAHRLWVTLERSLALRYLLAVVCVAVAIVLQMFVIGRFPMWSDAPPAIHPTGLFQICVVAAAWFGGAGPGFLAAVLTTLVLPLLIEMNYPLVARFFDLPRFVAFAVTGLAVGWGTTSRRDAEAALRRSELELRRARGELELKVLEQTAELRRSEALLAEAQRLSKTGSFAWNVATTEILWSEEMFRIFGHDQRTKPTMSGPLQPTLERVFQAVHPEDAAIVSQTLRRAAQTGEDFEYECRLLMPDASVRYIRVVAHAVGDGSKGIEYLGAVMNVTERKQAEEAFGKAQAELAHVTRVMTMGELTASIAHEVNQPLASIVANAEACGNWLAAATPNVEEARGCVSLVARDANRAGDIVKRIRTLVQKSERQVAPLDINDAIREVVALAEGEARRYGVTLRTELADDLAHVVGDRVQLQQVTLNLVMNGVEAMAPVADRPRQLVVRSRRDESDHVRVVVQDAGVGIERENLDKVFDTFYTTKRQGMGMGLAISRSIVEAHGGRLWAVSNDGPGMTFQFALPVESPPVKH